MRFGVLGPVAVWTDDGAPVTVPGTKVRALLADLLIHRGTLVTADQLIEDLWDGDPPAKPSGALQAKVSQLRRALESAEPGARELLVSRGPGYVLDVPPGAVDADRFAALVNGEPTADALAEALALWRGPALADVADAAFARSAVAELGEGRLAATEAHLDARSELGENDAVIAELTTLVARHPLRERLHAARLRALYRAGRQAEALARYDELRAVLAEELGADPSAELAALHEAILRQEPAPGTASGSASGTASGSGPPTSNLPAAWDETIGRDDEIDALREALAAVRLVTVVGPGGVGKTRLALEAARTVDVEEFPDGVWFVDLSAVGAAGADPSSGDAVAETVAQALGLRDDAAPRPGAPARGHRADVVDALRARRLLLVLDNCEHLLDPVADLVADLLRSAPGVRLLATSREPLGVRGEHLRPLESLPLPGPDTDPATSPAVRLFVARAAGADPSFALTEATAPIVVGVCRRLDGLPLALELAAARVRTLGLREVAARLDDRFALLDSGPRDAPPRQRTLRAVMDWSWEPLSGGERAVLRRLAVVREGAGAELIETVCAGDPVEPDRVLPVLARLVDRSLVVAAEVDGRTRWRMLETVAAYAAERLGEAGETDAVRTRLTVGCAELLERAAPHLTGPEQAVWLTRLDRESATVRTALDVAVAAGDGGVALRIVVAAHWYWYLRGRRATARRSLDRALGVADRSGTSAVPALPRTTAAALRAAVAVQERAVDDPVAHGRAALAAYDGLDAPHDLARARWILADALGGIGDLDAGEEMLDAAVRTFRGLDDRWGIAAAVCLRGTYDVMRGRLDAARSAAHEAGALFDEVGDRWGRCRAAKLSGMLDEIAGDYAAATREHLEGLRDAEELQLWPSAIDHRNRLGRLVLLAGDHDRADEHHRGALALAEEHGRVSDAIFARLGLGMSARRRGRLDEADEHLRMVLEWHGSTGYEPGTAITFAELGFLAEQRGDAAEAHRTHAEGLTIARASGDARAVALALEGLAGAAAADGEHERAGVLLGAAEAARAGTGAPLPAAERGDVDRITAVAVSGLGEAAFAAAVDRGRVAGPEGVESLDVEA